MDRRTLLEKTEDYDDFTTLLRERIYRLTRHHYISKFLKIFPQNLKSNLLINRVIILLDFSENFMQGESQGFHWENSQCTVHPLVVYHEKPNDDEIAHKSFCFLSPSTRHNASTVYTFISALMPKIKCFIPELSKICYYSDGWAGQYKKRFNFINFCYHKMDFDVECEWHFSIVIKF